MSLPALSWFPGYLWYYWRTWEYLRRNVGADRSSRIFPTIIQIGTHNRCNGRCQMCPYPNTVGLQPRAEMSVEQYERIIDEIAGWNISKKHAGMLALTLQNEPLLDSRLPELIAKARARLGRKWDVEITTNGVLLTGEVAVALAKSPPWAVNVSVNGFTQRTYDVTMPGFSVEKVFANIEAFLKIKNPETHLFIRYVKQQANDAEFVALKRYWNARGVAVLGYGCNDRLGDVRNYEAIRSRAAGAVGNFFRRVLGGRVFTECPFLFAQVNLLPSGQVLMCCHDYRHQAIIGDLSAVRGATPLADAFNSPEQILLRQEAKSGRYSGICLRCSLFRTHVWL